MDNTKDEGSLNRPPGLDDANNDYSKTKMVFFLKSIDNKTWKVVVNGWKLFVIISQDDITSLKSKVS